MTARLDKYEMEIEESVDQFRRVGAEKRKKIEGIIDRANAKTSISLRLNTNDLELLKKRAESEGLPYQTLLSSLVHKYVSDQLVDRRCILKSLELLKAS